MMCIFSTKKSNGTSRKSFITILSLFAILFASPAFYACGDDDDKEDGGNKGQSDKEQVYIKSPDAGKTFEVAAKDWPGCEIIIESNNALKDLNVRSSGTWCFAELKESGDNVFKLALSAEDNKTTDVREAIISVSDIKGNSVSFILRQEAGTSEPSYIEVPQLEARTLVVHANVAATFSVNGETKSGTEVEFINPSATGIISVFASGRMSKSIHYDFKDGAFLYFDVTLESGSAAVDQATAETAPAGVVNNYNGSDNANETGITAVIDFDGANNTNASAAGDYSITVFDPAYTSIGTEDLTVGQTYEESPLAFRCTPDGATFSSPIKVYLNIPGSEGYDLKIRGYDEEANIMCSGDAVIANIFHFSVWSVVMAVSCERMESQTNKIYEETVDAQQGTQNIKLNYGYECSQTNSTLTTNLLKNMFGGKKKTVRKRISWEPTEGTATIIVNQEVKTYTFRSGNKTFNVTAYGKVTSSVLVKPADSEQNNAQGGKN